MLDGILFEKIGVPAASIVTDVFQATGHAMAQAWGVPEYKFLAMPHPIANLTEAQLDLMYNVHFKAPYLMTQQLDVAGGDLLQELEIALVDPQTGGCRDGLHPDRANENRGIIVKRTYRHKALTVSPCQQVGAGASWRAIAAEHRVCRPCDYVD